MGLIKSKLSVQPRNQTGNEADAKKDWEKEQESFILGRTVKMLLYGPGECGKTTILRRMMLIHGNTDVINRELRMYRGRICFNVIEGAALVVKALRKFYGREFEKEFIQDANIILEVEKYYVETVQSVVNATLEEPNDQLVPAILNIYNNSKTFRRLLELRTEFSLFETWEHFAKKLSEYPMWGGPNWMPQNSDLLHSRIRSTGHSDFLFQQQNTYYELIDIGGQRTERKKFFFLFSEMDCLIFVASMSDYNERLYEDLTENRLRETLRVWKKTVHLPQFQDSYIILFLNKFDLFLHKYRDKKVPIPRYKGEIPPPRIEDEDPNDLNCEKARLWFHQVFMDKIPPASKGKIRPYVTTALEEGNNIARVMNLCVQFVSAAAMT
eukprot:maker-scaffold_69-snap-gene-0.52-mRNA-1 protein AED:0.05 eAED:0.05 QI:96/1/1/1/0.8/0.66/6/59/381